MTAHEFACWRLYPRRTAAISLLFLERMIEEMPFPVQAIQTDLDEFYATLDPKSPDLQQRLQEWQDHYNQYRPHGSLNGRTPWEAWLERIALLAAPAIPAESALESRLRTALPSAQVRSVTANLARLKSEMMSVGRTHYESAALTLS